MASKRLDLVTAKKVQASLLDSIRYAQNHPASALPTMRRYAQEFDDDVLMQHVELYVNDWTLDLGAEGAKALDELSGRFSKAEPKKLEILPGI